MELQDLAGKRVILKSVVRSAAGAYIGTREDAGRITEIGDILSVTIDDGTQKGEVKRVPVEEIYVSEAEHDSYVLGGTGPWERSGFVRVDDASYILEWECVQSDNVAFDKIAMSDMGRVTRPTSVISAIRDHKEDAFGMERISRAEIVDDLEEQDGGSYDGADIRGAYKVVRFDSVKQYNGLTPINRENYFTEEQANEVMTETARKFVKDVKKNGFLIDIKRLSDNSVRIEYVDRTGGEAYVIFQVFEEKRESVV